MEALLVGRTVQGLAGGLVAGLGYAVINTALPSSLWTKASALVSAMWGVGTLFGPAAGGLFAQFGSWRWAFGVLAILTAAVLILVPIALPARRDAERRRRVVCRSRCGRCCCSAAAALAVSVARCTARRASHRRVARSRARCLWRCSSTSTGDRPAAVLPPSVFRPGPLKWIYLTLGALMAATMVDMYVPLFGQRLAHLTPVAAGFLGVGLAIGWTVAEIAQRFAAQRPRHRADRGRRAPGDGDRVGARSADNGRGRIGRAGCGVGALRW